MSYKVVRCCLLLMATSGLSMHGGGLDSPLLGEGRGAAAAAARSDDDDDITTTETERLRSELRAARAEIGELRQERDDNLTTIAGLTTERDGLTTERNGLRADVARLDGTQLGHTLGEISSVVVDAARVARRYKPVVSAVVMSGVWVIGYLMHGCETCRDGNNLNRSGDSTALALCKKDLDYVRVTELALCNRDNATCQELYNNLRADCDSMRLELGICNSNYHGVDKKLVAAHGASGSMFLVTLVCGVVAVVNVYKRIEVEQKLRSTGNLHLLN